MSRIVRIARGFSLAWLAAFASQALADPPPLDAYGDLPGFEDAAISPSGQHVAIVGHRKGQRSLILLDAGMKVIGEQNVEGIKLRDVEWAGEDTALLTYSQTEDLPLGFTADQFESFRTVIVPLDPSKKVDVVFSGNVSIVTSVFGRYGVRRIGEKWKGYFSGIPLVGGTGNWHFETGVPALFEVDLPENSAKPIAKPSENRFWRDWLVDENGKVAATFDMNRTSGAWNIDDAKGEQIAIGTSPGGDAALVALGKDGDTLIYSARDEDGGTAHWYELPLTGKTPPVQVLQGVDVASIFVERSNGRLIGYSEGGKRQFFDPEIQKASDRITRAFKGREVRLIDWTPNFSHALVRTSGSDDSGTWFFVDLKALKAQALGVERPLIPSAEVGAISRFEYKAADGLEMDGILTLPPGREPRNLPVVMLPHGGPSAQDDPEFDWWAQAFASRGYAVFQPNFRGSTNRGEDFHRAGYGQWGRKMQTDISDGLAALAAAGIIDPKRACIMGASYGGYAALAGVTLQNGFYRCSVAVAPVSDLKLMYDTDYQESGTSRVVKTSLLEELGPRAGLDEVSPRRFAARADAPILLIHGRDDTVVPYEQSTKMIDALKDAGKPYEFVEMKEEDHWLSRAATRKQMLAAAMAFVQKYNPAD